jgi:hypothetical protein
MTPSPSSQEEARELKAGPSFARLQDWFFQQLDPKQRDGFLLMFGFDFGSTASFELRHNALREIHKTMLTRPTPDLGDVDGLVERIRDYIYDCTKDEFGHGWTLSGEQVRHIIALRAALDKKD